MHPGLILQRQLSVQVVRMQVKMAGQGSQLATQSARSEAQSRLHGQALGHWVVTLSQVTNRTGAQHRRRLRWKGHQSESRERQHEAESQPPHTDLLSRTNLISQKAATHY
jgi:hypothetical protein